MKPTCGVAKQYLVLWVCVFVMAPVGFFYLLGIMGDGLTRFSDWACTSRAWSARLMDGAEAFAKRNGVAI